MSAELIKMTDALYDYLHQVSHREQPILDELRAETASDARHTMAISPMQGPLEGQIADGLAGTIDLIFIDADKGNYWRYWNLGLELLRTGGVIIADNTLFQGMVEPSIGDDEIRSRFAERGPDRSESIVRSTHHLREFNRLVSMDARVALSMVPVGDGMTLGVKR